MDYYDFGKDMIFTAYKKVKHYYYYDNSTFITRKRMAKFEQEHLAGLQKPELKDKLKQLVDTELRKIMLHNIDIVPYPLPKKIRKPTNDIISNYRDKGEQFEVERLVVLADASVEVHIISTLWVMYVGRLCL